MQKKKRCWSVCVCVDSGTKKVTKCTSHTIYPKSRLLSFSQWHTNFSSMYIIFFAGKLSGNQYQYWKRQKKNETHKDRISLSYNEISKSSQNEIESLCMPTSRSCSQHRCRKIWRIIGAIPSDVPWECDFFSFENFEARKFAHKNRRHGRVVVDLSIV